MKAILSTAAAVPFDLLNGGSGQSALRLDDTIAVGMTIRRPEEYHKVIRSMPTGRALRRLIAKHGAKNK